jgi:hypothetical protein
MPSSGGPYSHGTLTEAKRGTWPAAHAGTMPNRPLAPAPAPTRPAPDWTTRNRVTTDFPLVTLERQEAGWTVSGLLPPSPSMPVGAQKLRPPEWCTDPGPASGEAFTHSILRPAWLMQNFTDDRLPVINGTLTSRAARVAKHSPTRLTSRRSRSRPFSNPDAHAGARYALTGPQAITFGDVAATIAAVSGRPVVYRTSTRRPGSTGRSRPACPPATP